jgi:hypothetical protein
MIETARAGIIARPPAARRRGVIRYVGAETNTSSPDPWRHVGDHKKRDAHA